MILLFAGCVGPEGRLTRGVTHYLGADGRVVSQPDLRATTHADAVSYWDGEGVSGAPSIVVNLTEQKAYFYKGGKLVGVSAISSGRDGYNTPTGNFRVTQRSRHHISNLYGNYVDAEGNIVVANVGVNRDPRPPGTRFQGSPMPYFLRIHGAVGLHAGYLPGFRDSSGCIRLPENMARQFFAHAPNGTPVRVTH